MNDQEKMDRLSESLEGTGEIYDFLTKLGLDGVITAISNSLAEKDWVRSGYEVPGAMDLREFKACAYGFLGLGFQLGYEWHKMQEASEDE